VQCLPDGIAVSGVAALTWPAAAAAAAAVGTITHMPPETLEHGIISKAADVYSFGVLLWQVGGCPGGGGVLKRQGGAADAAYLG
jgi:serine/threonine protein kinase